MGLFETALAFRQALETMPRADLIGIADFPAGACGDAAILLGQYLSDSGFGPWKYVSGERSGEDHEIYSHAWIEQDKTIVDITADQFAEIDEAVLVLTDSPWHRQFRRDRPLIDATIDVYDNYTQREHRMMYERALAVLADPDPVGGVRS